MQTVEEVYQHHACGNTAIAFHLPYLRALATGLALAVEFGVKRGASSAALLCGADNVVSFDVVETNEARQLEAIAGNRWNYVIHDSVSATVPECDLLFIDSLHDYEQCRAELFAHGNKSRKLIALHDTQTFWEAGAQGESGNKKWNYVRGAGSVPRGNYGIGQAILEFMADNWHWHVYASHPESHGLLVLRRQ